MQTQRDNQTENMENLPAPSVTSVIDLPPNPDFSFAGTDASCLASAYKVIHQNEAWNLLKNFDEAAFMIAKKVEINKLMNKVNDDWDGGHSGCSMGLVMRNMEFIANYGFNAFVEGNNRS